MQSLVDFNNRISNFFERNFFLEAKKQALIIPVIFVIVFTAYFQYIGVFSYLNQRPSSLHISAQCQRASVALNYYKGDMNFFKPQIQRQDKDNSITGVEFPVIYYTAAICYKLFGFHEIFMRVISLALVIIGIYFFYRFNLTFINNYLLAVMLVIAGTLSPVLLFYTPNFMPDAPSMALQLGAWYFIWQYMNNHKASNLRWFIVMASLGALIKATSAIIFFILIALLILHRLGFFKKESNTLFKNSGHIWKGIVVGLLPVFSWYAYAQWLTTAYGNQSFALRPLMVDDWSVAVEIFKTIKNLWYTHYFAYESYVLMLITAISLLLLFRFANRLLLSITVLYILGFLAYVYLFLYQFKWHDYYIIAIMPAYFFMLLTFGEMVYRFSEKYFKPTELVLMVVLFFNMKEAMIYCRKNYNERNSRDIYYWTGDYRAYEDLEPKLRNLGVQRTDKTISAFDDTYCSSLYLMDQLGVNISKETNAADIAAFVTNKNFKYMVLNDSAKFNKLYPNDFHTKVIATHRGLIIYKLR
jgi:hypothetical protein